jgi:hypothetical protein
MRSTHEVIPQNADVHKATAKNVQQQNPKTIWMCSNLEMNHPLEANNVHGY